MSRRKNKKKKKRKRRRLDWRNQQREEPRVPTPSEMRIQLFRLMRYLYRSFAVALAVGYLGPVLLYDPFAKYLTRAVVGTGAGVICSLLVFGGLHFLLLRDREPAEDFLNALNRSGFTAARACVFGMSAGAVFGLIYPSTAWIRPYTGGRSSDDVFGHFYWAPVGAVYAFAIASTWCYERAAAASRSNAGLTKLRMRF